MLSYEYEPARQKGFSTSLVLRAKLGKKYYCVQFIAKKIHFYTIQENPHG